MTKGSLRTQNHGLWWIYIHWLSWTRLYAGSTSSIRRSVNIRLIYHPQPNIYLVSKLNVTVYVIIDLLTILYMYSYRQGPRYKWRPKGTCSIFSLTKLAELTKTCAGGALQFEDKNNPDQFLLLLSLSHEWWLLSPQSKGSLKRD